MVFSAVNNDTIQVLDRMLQLCPYNRCTCTEALKMPFFSNSPGPTRGEDLPHPMSILEKLKNKSDMLRTNASKRKHSEDNSGNFFVDIKILKNIKIYMKPFCL